MALDIFKPFEVVVVAEGIAGLVMSHAQELAKTDHMMLKAYSDIHLHEGASIGLGQMAFEYSIR